MLLKHKKYEPLKYFFGVVNFIEILLSLGKKPNKYKRLAGQRRTGRVQLLSFKLLIRL